MGVFCLILYEKEDNRMETPKNTQPGNKEVGSGTRLLANLCHKCAVCQYASKKPESLFGRFMRWHRTWCPAWAAHTKVYGEKNSSNGP